MAFVNRLSPRMPLAVATVGGGQSALPHASDPSHATPPSAPAAPEHGHHGHHGHHASGHAGHAPHARHAGPAPKPRRPPKSRKTRRGANGSALGDEDGPEMPGEEARAAGTAAVTCAGGQPEGGDADDSGDEDTRREDRTLRSRFDEAPAVAAEPRRRPVDTSYAKNRYHRGIGELLAGPRLAPDAAARVAALDLELLHATPHGVRLEQGGLARARANLLAHAAPLAAAAERASPDSAAGRAHCIAVLKELQLQLRRSAQGRQRAMAQLEFRKRARTP